MGAANALAERRKGAARQRPRARDRRALICLVAAALALVVGLAATLAQEAPRRAGTNGIWPTFPLGTAEKGTTICQTEELLPAGTAVVELIVQSGGVRGPKLDVSLAQGERTIARSTVPAGWTGSAARAPIPPTQRDRDGVQVCFTPAGKGFVGLVGGPTPPGVGQAGVVQPGEEGRLVGASVPVNYLRAGEESWLSFASTVVERIGMGRGTLGGSWVAWLAGALLLASLALAARVVLRSVVGDRAEDAAPAGAASAGGSGLRDRLRRVPALAWTLLAIGALNAAAWSLVTPLFHVPDENTHVAYAQMIAEQGKPPIDRAEDVLAPEITTLAQDVRFGETGARTYRATVTSPLQQAQLEDHLDDDLARTGNDDAGPATPEPPLYYALEAIPYKVASGASLLDRMTLMRLLSALMAGVTAFFAFLFVRELLPRRPWAWAVGGLVVAFTPMLGFVSGGVNPDALLFPVCAALFYVLARAFRRGLSTELAIWIGVVLAVGAIAKINFYGLVPGALVALALAARASTGAWNGAAARLVGIAVGIGVAPYALVTLLDAALWERPFVLAHTPASQPLDHGGLRGDLSYLWQVYLPRLPFQDGAFPDMYPGYELWFKSFVGKFGWAIAGFPAWAYRVAGVVLLILTAFAVRALVVGRGELRRRLPELVGYVLVAGGLLLLIGMVAVRGWAPGIAGSAQGRYLLPLLPLFGALLALAARGGGERWGRALGAVIVVLAMAWTIFAQLVTISFFYG